MKTPRRIIWGLIPVVIVAGAGFLWLRGGIFKSDPPIPKGTPISMSLVLWDQTLSTTSNSAAINQLLKDLRTARLAQPHKCATMGTELRFQFVDGQTFKMGVHPGHETNAYEFAVAFQMYTTPRARFVESLKSAGLDVSKLPMDVSEFTMPPR